MTTMTASSNDVEVAGVRSAAYSLIANCFRYPNDEWLSSMLDPGRWDVWPERLEALNGDAYQCLMALRGALADSDSESTLDLLQQQFATLFGHTVRGACPPYELEYGRSEVIQRAAYLADLRGFYAAFGMEPGGETRERADHISSEAEFMTALCGKEAYGIEHENAELIESVCGAQRQFLKAHLGRWFPAFAQRVEDTNCGGFYAGSCEFAAAFVTGECKRLGVSAGSPYLALRPADPLQETTQSCGVPSECGVPTGEQLTQVRLPTVPQDR